MNLIAQTISVNAPKVSIDNALVGRIVGFIIFLAGALSVIFVLVGAFRYVVSGGDPAGTKGAKDTILYALIGLVVSASAYGIVKYVLGIFG